MQEMILPLKRYAQFEGRANRREYWMFQLFLLIVSTVLMVPLIAGLVMQSDMLGIASIILFVVFWLATFVPVIAVTVRRLHDCNQSGWMYLLAFVPFGGLVIFVFALLPGTPQQNVYGPVPAGP
ncbi:DUF805 domain-containing protein [[Pseudomonas] hibiscicola]|uniref:DUF805 domain-containing protein n=1 Tax=Stenotrophomonas hibiscicola TaxID=86189 RepID=A0ABV0C409_9GAMM|nr:MULTISPECIES: DUF805 domain-containing protein [Stenotrophomonas]MBH1444671.1 DUF805 domain-containing protein [Stenotrophomonas maltophilia]MBO0393517.1 DUF805 domain-containing protein [Stenotrophomonas maltophilia]MCR1006328.1 DUF805 domain-containing protein [Stenotrophomonas maltophilia]MCR1570775.1 DUF805 domain-containing protein [Stenotrophomonas sp.]QGL88718.1 DUF805 domain-containing protein [Stenotrophomonas maltophilia]